MKRKRYRKGIYLKYVRCTTCDSKKHILLQAFNHLKSTFIIFSLLFKKNVGAASLLEIPPKNILEFKRLNIERK